MILIHHILTSLLFHVECAHGHVSDAKEDHVKKLTCWRREGARDPVFNREVPMKIMFNPRELEKLMKNMKMEQIEATEVIIKSTTSIIRISNPQVVKSEMMGKITFQITGETEEENNGSDIDIIVQKTGVSREDAAKALAETGDIVAAIMSLEQNKTKK